jgi:hypothetical protein
MEDERYRFRDLHRLSTVASSGSVGDPLSRRDLPGFPIQWDLLG